MPTKSPKPVLGHAGFAPLRDGGSTRSSATPLVKRLLDSAANAEGLIKGGAELSGSDEEVLALLRKTPISSD